MKSSEGSTAIGRSVVVRGELSGNEDLYIDGDLEGTIALTENCLTIGPNAHILADIKVRDLVVSGSLTGNIYASGRIDLRQSAAVKGDVFASRLSIEEGAMLKGRVELTATRSTSLSPGRSDSFATAKDDSTSFVLAAKG
jgi:cytoskeletal protein CcmA (bactofilin family)